MSYYRTYDFETDIKQFELKWDLDMEDKIRILTKLKKSKTFNRIFNPAYNLTDEFQRYTVKYGLARTDHFIYSIKGRTGSGKSSVGAVILYWLYKDKIDIKNVVFNHMQQKKLLKEMTDCKTIMRDEQTRRVGLGSMAESLEVQNWDETLRKPGINFIYIAPTDRFHGTAHKNLEYIARNKSKRISMFALYDGGEHSKYYTGYVLFRIPTTKWWKENGNSFWSKYQYRKDKFNEATMSDTHGIDWNMYIEEIKDHQSYKENLNHNQLKAIITEIYIFQPKELRDTIMTMYLARVGMKSKALTKPDKPDNCEDCNSISLRYYRREKAWGCMQCGWLEGKKR